MPRIGYGTLCYLSTSYDDVVAGTGTAFTFLADIGLEGYRRELVDSTPLSSTGYREYLPTLLAEGELPLTLHFSTTDKYGVDRLTDEYLNPLADQKDQLLYLTLTVNGTTMPIGANPPTASFTAKVRLIEAGLQIPRDDLITQPFRFLITQSYNETPGIANITPGLTWPTTAST